MLDVLLDAKAKGKVRHIGFTGHVTLDSRVHLLARGAEKDASAAKVVPDRLTVAEALHFVWSLPVSVLVSGAETPEMIQEKIDLARSFQAMEETQRQQLIHRVADLAGPAIETYKVPPV